MPQPMRALALSEVGSESSRDFPAFTTSPVFANSRVGPVSPVRPDCRAACLGLVGSATAPRTTSKESGSAWVSMIWLQCKVTSAKSVGVGVGVVLPRVLPPDEHPASTSSTETPTRIPRLTGSPSRLRGATPLPAGGRDERGNDPRPGLRSRVALPPDGESVPILSLCESMHSRG